MNSNEIKGKIKEVGGDARRKVGELTGDDEAQARGAKDAVEGNIQKNVGKVQDAVKKASS